MDRWERDDLWRKSQSRCGNCQHWMKLSDCPREETGKPSASACVCKVYQPTNTVVKLKKEYQKEVELLSGEPK